MAVPGLPNWDLLLAQKLGVAPTPEVIRFLHSWAQAEGGNATNNPFNTTQPGYTSVGDYNSIGVKNYAHPMGGIDATVATLKNGRYGNILQAMGKGTSATEMAQALANSPWGTGSLVLKVLGAGGPAVSTPQQRALGAGKGPTPLGTGGGSSSSLSPKGKPPVLTTMQSLLQNAAPSALTQQLISQDNPQLGALVSRLQAPIPLPKPVPQAIPQPKVMANPGGKPVVMHGVDPTNPTHNAAANLVQSFIGTPYVWGGARPGGFDCSGLVQYTYGKLGVSVPRTSQQQFKAGTPVSTKNLQPGDALFFVGSDGTRSAPGHEGMYIGNGEFVEAPHTGASVRISQLAGRTDYVGARRF